MKQNHGCSGDAQEGEPQQHAGTEGFADFAGTGVLDGEQDENNRQCNHHDFPLTFAQEPVHDFDASQSFHRSGHGNGWGENTICQQSSSANHGRKDEPLAVIFHQGVEGEDAAFPVVVCFQCDEDKLDGGKEGYGPDDQRQGADDEGFINLADAAVSCHDGFHYIKR